MKYEAWLNYPDMIIVINNTGGKYRCSEYGLEETTRRSFKDCDSDLELKFFLLSLPNAPKKEIISLITKLQVETIKKRSALNKKKGDRLIL